jgi:cytochrome c oxidase cbb3-type subunit 4
MAKWHLIWTLLLFSSFIGIVIWAFSAARKQDFSEAAQLPLEDEIEVATDLQPRDAKQENTNG